MDYLIGMIKVILMLVDHHEYECLEGKRGRGAISKKNCISEKCYLNAQLPELNRTVFSRALRKTIIKQKPWKVYGTLVWVPCSSWTLCNRKSSGRYEWFWLGHVNWVCKRAKEQEGIRNWQSSQGYLVRSLEGNCGKIGAEVELLGKNSYSLKFWQCKLLNCQNPSNN